MTDTSGPSEPSSLGVPTYPYLLEAIPRGTEDADGDDVVDLSAWR